MKKPDEYEILERAHEAAGAHMMQKSPRAEELIAFLEGEIAKRDARILELEADRDRIKTIADNYSALNMDAQAELAAIKAQEPVAWEVYYADDDSFHAITRNKMLIDGYSSMAYVIKPLYAAPVSEAKAQGVVKWPEADEIMQMAFEEGQPADDASGYCFELEEFDLFIERLMSEVARLNTAPAQQVSVPVHWTGCHDADIALNLLDRIDAPDDEDRISQLEQIVMRMGKQFVNSAMLANAPAAPAADAWLVEALGYQVLFDAIAAATSVYANGAVNISVQVFRDALAAHRAKGVL